MKLDLNDLKPAEAHFQLSDKGEKQYTLRKFSLASQVWMREKFGKENVQGIFKDQNIPAIAEIAHHQLKDSSDFPTFMDFCECIITQQDRIAVMMALLHTIGISQPVIAKLTEEANKDPKAEALNQAT